MFPKTTYPDDIRALLLSAVPGARIPLWQAAPLTAALAAAPVRILPDRLALPLPPEAQLHGSAPGEAGAVYRLCALLVRLLSGAELPQTAGTAERRAVLRAAAGAACPDPEGAQDLFRLLDRGLRLEPSRRFSDRRALLSALGEAEAGMDARARSRLCLRGTAGVFSGRDLPLVLPALLGRQPGACRILFPPDTPGVSRRHCRLELIWGTVVAADLDSRYGTAVDGVPLLPDCPAALLPGQVLALAGGGQSFMLTEV